MSRESATSALPATSLRSPTKEADSSGPPTGATAALLLADGSVFYGYGYGAIGDGVGEICFNTAMTGYQEILSDPSYAEQIITFTFPHIGNVGTNSDDSEREQTAAIGCITHNLPTAPSNYRSTMSLVAWMEQRGLIGMAAIDSRRLTHRLRTEGAINGAIAHHPDGDFDIAVLQSKLADYGGLVGAELASQVSRSVPAGGSAGVWSAEVWSAGVHPILSDSYGDNRKRVTATAPPSDTPKERGDLAKPSGKLIEEVEKPAEKKSSFISDSSRIAPDRRPHIILIDYGCKDMILRNLVRAGARVTIVPAQTAFHDIAALAPDGILLSNGPGDPAATAIYAVPIIREILEYDIPIFGICLGHQLLAQACGAKTIKMHQGHHGANHPVKRLADGAVEITSMNHGFAVDSASLPEGVIETHHSLFDGTNCGIALAAKRSFSVQYHPEASPGPQDSFYLFEKFITSLGKDSPSDR